MEIVYARGHATANEVLADLPDPPSRTSVRTLMRILEEKGHLVHTTDGREFVYRPTRKRSQAGRRALRTVLKVFFGGSIESAVAAHLADPQTRLSQDQAERLKELIEHAKKAGR